MTGPIKAIIFDFDGVICESVAIKAEAFRRLFDANADEAEAAVKVHMDNGGLSRFSKFAIIYRDILKKELTQEESLHLSEKFTEYCIEGVIKSEYVKGAKEFLEKYHNKMMLFVCSGTPYTELITVIRARHIEKYFKGIYGSPPNKDITINKILALYSLLPKEVIFVGDSRQDMQWSQQTGVNFIGRVHEKYPNPFLNASADGFIKNLGELDKYLPQGILESR